MNVRLLRRVQKHILQEPNRLMMGDYVWHDRPGVKVETDGILHRMPECGTAACIAGWTCLLEKNPKNVDTYVRTRIGKWSDTAAALLGISKGYDRLFFVDYWPERFQERFYEAKTKLQQAKITAKRIDFFINTKGTDLR